MVWHVVRVKKWTPEKRKEQKPRAKGHFPQQHSREPEKKKK